MHLSAHEVSVLDEEGLRRFLERRIEEGYQIDYKEALSGDGTKTIYREFLKDTSGFANANGGILILGAKEPKEDLSVDEQLVGLPDGSPSAQDLERVAASSLDPRIPGLLIKPIVLAGGRSMIIVLVPPSLRRPHMVDYKGHRAFYIRHTESTVPMATHEIRESVLATATAEGAARAYLGEQERDAADYYLKGPCLLLQAMPLIAPSEPWDLRSHEVALIVDGRDRCNKFGVEFGLGVPEGARPSIMGIRGCNDRSDPRSIIDIHRNGYVQAWKYVRSLDLDDGTRVCLHENYGDLFRAFCELVGEVWQQTQTDLPYIFRLKFLYARNSILLVPRNSRRWSEPCDRPVLAWEDQIRQVGESLEHVHQTWFEQMYDAFGLPRPSS